MEEIKRFYLEESKVNKGKMIVVAVTYSGKKFVMSGDHYSPTYATPYENQWDTKPLNSQSK